MRFAGALVLAMLLSPMAHAQTADPHRPLTAELSVGSASGLVLILVGGLPDDGTKPPAGIADIVSGANRAGAPTVTVGPLETVFSDPGTGYPQPWGDAPPRRAAPSGAGVLAAAGIDMVARANGHALDWGFEGMRATTRALDSAGIVGAGIGEHLGLARAAAYFDHPDGAGRIALIAMTTSFRPTSEALAAYRAAPGRPGVSAIDVATVRLVPPEIFGEVQRIACRMARNDDPGACATIAPATEIAALGSRFEIAPAYATRHVPDETQVRDAQRGVRQGKQGADLLVAWINAGQGAAIAEKLARSAIDAGADVAAASGGGLDGIALHRGPDGMLRPIFLGLGDPQRDEGAAVAQTRFVRGAVLVDLFPVGNGVRKEGARGRAILADIARRSEALGTRVAILESDDGIIGRIEAG